MEWIFIDWQTTLECVLIALFFACFLSLLCFRPLGILQSFNYRGGKLLKWAGRKSNLQQARFSLVALSTALAYSVIALCFSFVGKWSAVIGLIAFAIFFVLYLVSDARRPYKGDPVLTPRLKRLFITLWLTFAIAVYIAATLLNFADYVWGARVFTSLRYAPLSLFPLLALFVVCLANLISKIWEKPINYSFVKAAKRSLAAAEIKVVGITGSFGKTSAKNILSAMLAKKYRVLATPSSFNTPLGVAKTVNGSDLSACDVLIAEMGARRKGDIEELCKLCRPDYSLITGICPQHIESFKTLENVVSTKGEIIAGTENTCFIARDCFKYFENADGEKAACDCVSEVSATCEGTEFTLTLGGESKRVKTVLLGEHSAYNIGLCAQAAYALSVPSEDIVKAIEELDFTEHRLQLIKSNGVNILDDGYNSNVVGARAAIDVLKLFSGKKIAVTPGLVELGILEESENRALGEELVGLDYVILVGETLVRVIMEGYLAAGGREENICVVPTLERAQDKLKDMISKGDAVLFLNDLPEQYL